MPAVEEDCDNICSSWAGVLCLGLTTSGCIQGEDDLPTTTGDRTKSVAPRIAFSDGVLYLPECDTYSVHEVVPNSWHALRGWGD